jgi:hypothetical protein
MSQTAIAAALMMLYAAPVASAANAAATAENAAVSAEKSAELPTWLGTGQWVAPPGVPRCPTRLGLQGRVADDRLILVLKWLRPVRRQIENFCTIFSIACYRGPLCSCISFALRAHGLLGRLTCPLLPFCYPIRRDAIEEAGTATRL